MLCIGSLARGPAGAVRIHIARPEPAGAAPFAVTVALEDDGAEARGADAFSAMLPRKITVEVFAGAADCSGESVLNATELVLAPQEQHAAGRAGGWSLPPLSLAVGPDWQPGTYLACVFVEGEHGYFLASEFRHFTVAAEFPWTLSALLHTRSGLLELRLDLGDGGIRSRDLRLLEGARVEAEVDGAVFVVAGDGGEAPEPSTALRFRAELRWRRSRTRLVTWSEMKRRVAQGGVEAQDLTSHTSQILDVRHHRCRACVGSGPQDLLAKMAETYPELQALAMQAAAREGGGGVNFAEWLSSLTSVRTLSGSEGVDDSVHSGRCYGNMTDENILQNLQSHALLLVLGSVDDGCGVGAGTGAGDAKGGSGERESAGGRGGKRGWGVGREGRGGGGRLTVAKWLAHDVEVFMSKYLQKRGGRSVALIICMYVCMYFVCMYHTYVCIHVCVCMYVHQRHVCMYIFVYRSLCVALIGERLAHAEPSAREGVHSSWAAEAAQLIASVRMLERTSGPFDTAYVVSDGSLPEVYMYVYLYNTYIHTDMHACMHSCMHECTCMHAYTNTQIHKYIHTYIHACMHAYV